MKQYRVTTNWLSRSYDDSGVTVSEWFENETDAVESARHDRDNLKCLDDPTKPVGVSVVKQLRSGRELPIAI